MSAENSILAAAKSKDEDLLCCICGIDLVAKEALYHNHCRQEYTRKEVRYSSAGDTEASAMINAHEQAFQYICNYVEDNLIRELNVEREAVEVAFGLAYSDERTTEEAGPLLLTSTGTKLLRQDTNNLNNVTVILKDLGNVTDIEPSKHESAIYFIDIGARAIKKVSLPDHDVTMIIPNVTALGLTYDWLSQNLYWTNFGGWIEVSDIKGMNRKTLFLRTTNKPKEITLDPNVGYMFWTDNSNNEGKIERAALDGDPKTQIAIVHNDFLRPIGISTDLLDKKLYWADSYIKYIHSSRYDGSDRKVVFMNDVIKPYTLTVLEETLYILGRNSSVYKCDKVRCDMELLFKYTEKTQAVAVVHDFQPVSTDGNICSKNITGCSHLCLTSTTAEEKVSCECPDNFALQNDNRTCIKKDLPMALISFGSKLSIQDIHNLDNIKTVVDDLVNVTDIEVIKHENNFFYADIGEEAILKFSLNGNESTPFIANINALGIAYDWVSTNVYWTNVGGWIEVCDINGDYRKTLIWRNTQQLSEISLDAKVGYIFWTDFSGDHGKIERAYLDGNPTTRIRIINEFFVKPAGITLDYSNQRIYWTYIFSKYIYSSRYDGSDRRSVFTNGIFPYKISVYDESLYFLDQNSSLYTCDKVNCTYKLLIQYTETAKDIAIASDLHLSIDKDINNSLCNKENGGCNHLCLTSYSAKHNFTCACSDNFELQKDRSTCKEKDLPNLLLMDRKGIRMFEGKYEKKKYTTTKFRYSVPMDYLFKRRYLYWVKWYRGGKSRIMISLQEKDENMLTSTKKIYGLACDWLGNNIYFVGCKRVKVSDIRARNVVSLFYDRKKCFYDIALDPRKRYMFLLTRKLIFRIGMDGNKETIRDLVPSRNKIKLRSLTIDLKERQIYWIENMWRSFRINRCKYDGSNQKKILKTTLFQPYRIAVYRDNLYWLDKKSSKMYTCHKVNAGNTKMIKSNVDDLYDFRVYEKEQQPEGINKSPCNSSDDHCSHLCLLSPLEPYFICACPTSIKIGKDNRTCLDGCKRNKGVCSHKCKPMLEAPYYYCTCDGGYTLDVDNKTCLDGSKDVVFVATGFGIYRVRIDNRRSKRRLIKVKFARHLKFDPITRHIIWAENGKLSLPKIVLKQLHIDTKEIRILDTIAVDVPDFGGLGIDWLERKLFISVQNTIRYLNLENFKKYTILSGNIKPKKLSLDPFHRMLYWINHGKQPTIKRSNYDGSYLETILSSSLPFPLGIVVDYVSGNIYWNDGKKHVIEEAKTDGSSRKIFYQTVRYTLGTSAAIQGDYLFWDDGYSIFRWNKTYLSKQYRFFRTKTKVYGFTSANIQKFINKESTGFEEKCPEIAKCWGINNKWICLNRNMICNRKPECFGEIDEFYCCSKCGLPEISINCKSAGNSRLNNNLTLNFVMWESHPFSDVFQEGTFFTLQCSMEAVYSDENNLKRKISFHNLQRNHVFRQFTGRGVFRNTNATVKLTLSGDILNLEEEAFLQFGMLEELVISKTQMTHINNNTFVGLNNLKILTISENPFLLTIKRYAFNGLFSLEKLIIVANGIQYLMAKVFDNVKTITFLNVSGNSLQSLDDLLLKKLSALKVIDLRHNDLHLTGESFENNNNLTHIYVDSYSFCCIKPPSVEERNCVAPKYDISTCENLIQDRALRAFLWIVGILACIGNITVLVYRSITKGSAYVKETFSIFVSNLGVSDAIMGLYMLIIAVHDAVFDGNYVWHEYDWKQSMVCKLSGILAFISSESSVLFIILITVDRCLVVKYPLGNRRLSSKHAHFLTLSAWVISLLVALIPVFAFDGFYSNSDVCIALPLTGEGRQGWLYSMVIVLGFNFIAFLFIAIGQICIFREIRLSAKNIGTTQGRREMSVAKNLSMVVLTDCLCWLPIGILASMALTGTKISREVYAWIIVFVLPVNSAINPIIYTFLPACKQQALKLKKRKQKETTCTSRV